MDPVQLEKLESAIALQINTSVEKYVNGHLRDLKKDFSEYVEKDMEWKAQAQPAINLGNNAKIFGTVGAGVVGIVGAVCGAIIGVIEVIKRLK